MSSQPPRGPDEVRAALIAAAAELFAERGDASVRAIAELAGVNHGLVHHYFGGKEALRAAALDHLASSLDARTAQGGDDVGDLVGAAIDALRTDDRFLRVLARSYLDGDKLPTQSAYPVVRRLIQSLEAAGVPDPASAVAEGLASALGWRVFGEWIRESTGVAPPSAAELPARVAALHRPSRNNRS